MRRFLCFCPPNNGHTTRLTCIVCLNAHISRVGQAARPDPAERVTHVEMTSFQKGQVDIGGVEEAGHAGVDREHVSDTPWAKMR